jgi:hypothetical protein
MIGFIGTSLQLQSIITAHTLNCFWPTNLYAVSRTTLELISLSWIHELTPILYLPRGPNISHHVEQLIVLCNSICCHGMSLLIFEASETGICVPWLSKLTSAPAAIPAFRPCLPSRCPAMDYSATVCCYHQILYFKSIISFQRNEDIAIHHRRSQLDIILKKQSLWVS